MNILIPIGAAVGVYLLVKYGSGSYAPPGGMPAGAGSPPVPGGTPETSPSQGDLGGLVNNPAIITPVLGAGESQPCPSCATGQATGTGLSGNYIMTGPKPVTVRDHRTASGVKTHKVSAPQCIRAPCPSTPMDGKSDPQATSAFIRARFGNEPSVW